MIGYGVGVAVAVGMPERYGFVPLNSDVSLRILACMLFISCIGGLSPLKDCVIVSTA